MAHDFQADGGENVAGESEDSLADMCADLLLTEGQMQQVSAVACNVILDGKLGTYLR
ncbi:MAG: hypothetical protein ACLSTO_00950 [Bilophila wadsworthia]